MDINNHLALRSFINTSEQPFIFALLFALVIHSLFFILWKENEKPSVAELPEWINIKLSFGIEEKNKTDNKRVIKTQNEIINSNKIKTSRKTKNNLTDSVLSGKTTTFIAADSRPYDLENPKPIYPASARHRGMQGVVLLQVNINEKGYVDSVSIVRTSGFNILDRTAVKSVERWKFIPAKDGGVNVTSTLEIPIRFILKKL